MTASGAPTPRRRSWRDDWRLLAALRARQRARARKGGQRWPVLLLFLPSVLAGYAVMAAVVASLLPAASLAPDSLLGLTCIALVARALGRGLDEGGPALARGGLTQLLSAPLHRRVLVAEWLAGEVLAAAVVAIGVVAWLAVVVFGPEVLARVPGLAVGTLAGAGAAVGLRGATGILAPRLPAWTRWWLALAAHALAGAAILAVAAALVGARIVAPPGPISTLVSALASVAAPFGRTMAEPGVTTWWLPALAIGALLGALPLVLAPRADVGQLLLAAAREADRRRPDRATRRGHRARAPGFGRGAAALVWKVMAERAGGAAAPRPALAWPLLLATGLALAWLAGPQAFGPGVPAALAALVMLAGVPAGGRGTSGLAGELTHPSWLLRLPGAPERLLAALLVPPVARLAAVGALLALPLAVRTPDALPATIAAVVAGAIVAFASHLQRAACWLAEPPWQPGDAEAAVAEVRALALSPALAMCVAGFVWLGAGWPAWAALLAGAVPSVLLASAHWPGVVRAWRRLELAPRVAADPRTT